MYDGHLSPTMLRHAHLKDPAARGEPSCTHSRIIRYLDATGNWVAEVHQYLRPDGTRGGSGKPDPKRLRIGSTILVSTEGFGPVGTPGEAG